MCTHFLGRHCIFQMKKNKMKTKTSPITRQSTWLPQNKNRIKRKYQKNNVISKIKKLRRAAWDKAKHRQIRRSSSPEPLLLSTTLQDTGDSLLNFPGFTEHNLCSIFIIAREISTLIRSLYPKKTTDPDNTRVVILKNINPELFPILPELFNRWLKEKSFPRLWNLSRACRGRVFIPLSV